MASDDGISLDSAFPTMVSNHLESVVHVIRGETKHDKRLTTAVWLGYADYIVHTHKPTGIQIVCSLAETTKTVSIPLDAYSELLNETHTVFAKIKRQVSGFVLPSDTIDNFCAYLKEQYDTNKKAATASRYTALLVLSHPAIRLPFELCKKIVALIDLEEPKVFKVDILMMLRIYSNASPDTLPPHLYAIYKRLCIDQVSS